MSPTLVRGGDGEAAPGWFRAAKGSQEGGGEVRALGAPQEFLASLQAACPRWSPSTPSPRCPCPAACASPAKVGVCCLLSHLSPPAAAKGRIQGGSWGMPPPASAHADLPHWPLPSDPLEETPEAPVPANMSTAADLLRQGAGRFSASAAPLPPRQGGAADRGLRH